MQLFRHTGVIIAVFWCAAMIVAPMAAAGQDMNQGSGPQGMNPGQGNQGNNQMQTGQGTGSGNGQNIAGPGQGNGPQGMGRGNGTEFGNRSLFRPDDGNMTAPPDWDTDNSTAFNKTERRGPWSGNMTGMNMTGRNMTGMNLTGMPPRGDWDPANMTAMNQTGRHGNGNMTPPDQSQMQGNGNNQGPQGTSNQQPGQTQQQTRNLQGTTQNNSSDSLIAELIDWLKAHGVT
jgi:hypothetical protein